jgi:hypothetical protein
MLRSAVVVAAAAAATESEEQEQDAPGVFVDLDFVVLVQYQ